MTKIHGRVRNYAQIPIQTPWVYLEINMGLGFAMNSYSGATLSTHGGVCVGEAGNCVGMEQGGSLYFDRSGGFSGMTVYTELYLQIAGEGRISTGYEAGLLGAEGRGLYAGASAFGVHAEVSQNGGWSYGDSKKVDVWKYSNDGYVSRIRFLGGMIDYTSGIWAADFYDSVDPIIGGNGYGEFLLDNDESNLTIMVHGTKGTGNALLEGMVNIDGYSLNAEVFFDTYLSEMDLKDVKKITLYACSSGAGGEYSFAQKLANVFFERTKQYVTIHAPTQDIFASRTKIFTDVTFKSKVGMWLDFTPQQRYQYDRGF